MFESFVNSERCKTFPVSKYLYYWFESFVNSERCKTIPLGDPVKPVFESFVNSERCKTVFTLSESARRLRALLIQKDVKQ